VYIFHLNENCITKLDARIRFKHKVHKQKIEIKFITVMTQTLQHRTHKVNNRANPVLISGLRVQREMYGKKQQDSGQHYVMEGREGDAL
jgi:hypothetical protein